jgi:hypothetical protein
MCISPPFVCRPLCCDAGRGCIRVLPDGMVVFRVRQSRCISMRSWLCACVALCVRAAGHFIFMSPRSFPVFFVFGSRSMCGCAW